MTRHVRVALAQLACAPLDARANADMTATAISDAARQGASIVVLPELCASGYVLDHAGLNSVAESAERPGRVLGTWARAAARHRINVVGGFAETAGDQLFNSAAVFASDGSLLAVYRKLHLFAAERDVFTPGDSGLPVIDVDGIRLGVLICYDLRFPESLRILALGGAELVAVPTAWVAGFDRAGISQTPSRIGQTDGVLVQANLDGVFVACADQVGVCGGVHFLGRSLVADPYGAALLGPLEARAARLATVDVDLAMVETAQDRGAGIRPRADRRTDVYDDMLGYRSHVTSGERI